MKIVVLQGSPRKSGNTQFLVEGFKEGAEKAGHSVEILNVGNMKIAPCLSCEYCHTKGNGECVQKDDMKDVETKLMSADMIVLASAVHYFNFTGQLQNVISRFYAKGTMPAKKYSLILSSYSPDVYSGIVETYKHIVAYSNATDMGMKCINGVEQKTDDNKKLMIEFGSSIK
ncbi:MAG: flavodoxin family protein [Lachnospiraceae bacterium]|nr:flavodoxin family protein [Lachnospiraceae bacterium]